MSYYKKILSAVVISVLAIGFVAITENRVFCFPKDHTSDSKGRMFDLGTLGGTASQANGINDLGQVVGQSETPSHAHTSSLHAFLWTPTGSDGVPGNRQMKDLGTLGGNESLANEINNAGQIVGVSQTANGDVHAVLWLSNGETIIDLGTLGGFFSEASAINDFGQVVGVSETMTGSLHAFLWTPNFFGSSQGTMTDLGSLGDFDSYASGINNAGQITGVLATQVDHPGDQPSNFRAFLWTPEQPRGDEGTMVDIGSLGGSDSGAGGINSFGQVAGVSLTPNELGHAFLWTPEHLRGSEGSMVDLGTLGGPDSFGTAVNDVGQVAGDASIVRPRYRRFLIYPATPSDKGTPYSHAFLWTPGARDGVPGNRQMKDLGTLGGASSFVHTLNNRGMVAGASNVAGSGAVHAFLWIPID